jgi:gamma-glutamylcyclotransferase (GGCT)/AIG2-like uncharacterized protein YtfP
MPDAPAPTASAVTPPPGRRLLFVYGTLKRGGSNHGWLEGQVFLGEARTEPGVTLYSLGEYPGLVADPADREGVTGELWAVDDAALARLDRFEGVAEGLYVREPARLADYPRGLRRAQAATAQLYRYARKVDRRARIGSTWRV